MIYRGYVRCNRMTSCIASLCVLPLFMLNEHTYARIYAHIRQWRRWWWKLKVNMHCKQITSYNDYLLLKCRQEYLIFNIAIQTSPPLFHLKRPTFVGQICILLKYEHLIWNRIYTFLLQLYIKVDILEIRLLNIFVYCKHFDSQ